MTTARIVTLAAALVGLAAVTALADAPLTAQNPIVIPGGPGGFDWMRVDGASRRVFATHKGTKTVAIVDMKTEMALSSVTVGTAQGVALDRLRGHREGRRPDRVRPG